MWRVLLFLVLAIGTQGRTFQHVEENDLLKHLEKMLYRLQREDAADTSMPITTGVTANEATNDVPDDVAGSNPEMPGIIATEKILLMVEQHKPELLSMYVNDVEDLSVLSDALFALGEIAQNEMPAYKPCIILADLIGAIRYSMVHELQPGMYETLKGALDHVMMETGHMISTDRTQLENIQHAIYQPVYYALEKLECDIGIGTDCPGPNDIDTVTAPRSSPSEELYWTITEYLDSVDMKTKSVGEIVADILSLWSKFVDEKYIKTGGTCDENIVAEAPMILKASIDKLSLSMAYEYLLSRISAVVPDEEIARSLTELLIKNHFVDDYLAMKMLGQVLEEAHTEGFEVAVMKMSARVLSFIYESSKDQTMLDLVSYELHQYISKETLMAPLYTLGVQNYIDGAEYLIYSIMKHWQTPCLNARFAGIFAAIADMHKSVALLDPRVGGAFSYVMNELDVSITDSNFQQAFDDIIQATVKDVFKPFTDAVYEIAGRQPTEVVFMELARLLSRPDIRFAQVHDMLMAVGEIVIPLMGHDHTGDDMESPFKCDVSDEQLMHIIEEAYNLKHSLIHTSEILSDVKAILVTSFPDIPSDKINAMASKLVNELTNVVMRDTLVTLQFFEDVENSEVMDTVVHFFAVNAGYFVHSILQKHPDSQAPILPSEPEPTPLPSIMPPTMPPTMNPPVSQPTSGPYVPSPNGPTAFDYLQWQQQLVSNFVMQYMSGMMHYNIASVSSSLGSTGSNNPCLSMPELCALLQEHLIGVVKDYGPFVKRGMEVLNR